MSKTSEPEFDVGYQVLLLNVGYQVLLLTYSYHLLKLRLVALQALGILQEGRVGMVHLYNYHVKMFR